MQTFWRVTLLALVTGCMPMYRPLSPMGAICLNQCTQVYWACANGQPNNWVGIAGVALCADNRVRCSNGCPEVLVQR